MTSRRLAPFVVFSIVGLLTCAPCGASEKTGSIGQIDHIVIIVQENRSFDNLFEGFPHAHSSPTGKLPNGGTTRLKPVSLAAPYDISHAFQDAKTAYDRGRMDGFAYEYTGVSGSRYPQYGYVPRAEIEPYWDLAQQYVLADKMFASQLDGSYVAHQYLIAGWAGGTYNYPAVEPWGCDAPPGNAIGLLDKVGQPFGLTVPCFSYSTIADELDAKGISWRYYAPKTGLGYSWTAYDAIAQIRRGPDWKKDVVSPETRILTDVQKGHLAAVTWIVPSLPLSDHPDSRSRRGPSWVASVVNAIGKSDFWSSTAIFVTWDDWGGWYDDVAPPQLDYAGLGFRVPLICISPFAKSGYVDHTQYEFGSMLKFIESRFGLPSLGRTDARAKAPLNCFNFQQRARAFQTISAPLRAGEIAASATDEAPDDQ
ncbi:MAG TPA: alkaline phosphatase family protein [Candidatus Cybelea sp.]|nr:alkaline phosphatase family protein [Candidatus Cybelea sp.]